MSHYKILCTTFPWECDCCGWGQHVAIGVYENIFDDNFIIWRGSKNDQFGGPLNVGDETIRIYSDVDDYLEGMKTAFELLGHKVTIYIDGELQNAD